MLLMDHLQSRARFNTLGGMVSTTLFEARRFVFDERGRDTCFSLAVDPIKLKKSRDWVVMPHNKCWFEWMEGPKQYGGLLFFGADTTPLYLDQMRSVEAGVIVFVRRDCREDPEALYEVAAAGVFNRQHPDVMCMVPISKNESDNRALYAALSQRKMVSIDQLKAMRLKYPSPVADRVGWMLLAFLVLLASPKLYTTVEVDHVKLNNTRRKQKRFELLPHSVVRIDLGVHDAVLYRTADGEGGKRCLHFVRAHVRIRFGQLEVIKPHWRGDGELGIKSPRYWVTDSTRRMR